MTRLTPFGSLPAFRPRTFLPPATDLGDWSCTGPLFDRLDAMLAACSTGSELEAWLLAWSELGAALEEESACRFIAMTCHTEDPAAEKAYLQFVEEIEPRVKPRQFAIAQALTTHPACGQLSKPHHAVLLRDLENQVRLFRPENVALETRDTMLGQQYQKLMGGLTVTFQGTEKTLIQMGRYQEEPDRELRREAWELVVKRRLEEQEKFEDILDQLLALRAEIALNAGFSNYRDYMFRKLGRFDYGPEDCARFHDAVALEVVPVIRELQAERRLQLQVETLRPWDAAVDPLGRPPLRPFATVGELVSRTQSVFDAIDPGLAASFRKLDELHLLDLENRKGKAPGGYQSTLSESRLPFIFMNAVGVQRDVDVLLHEAGHAFHTFAVMEMDLLPYRNPPMEICEVASMSMELLGNQQMGAFHTPDAAARARRDHLEKVLTGLSWIATVDAFQHWIYTHPGHTRQERAAAWTALVRRFEGDTDWSGQEQALNFLWHRQLHIFLYPFYYIEYGIAQLGALQVWAASKRDRASALANYKRGLALGGSRPLPELFAWMGCKFDFSREAIAPLVHLVREDLSASPDPNPNHP